MMRVSLYPHELAVVERLTITLTRMRMEETPHLQIEEFAPSLFSALIDAMYSRGNHRNIRWELEDQRSHA